MVNKIINVSEKEMKEIKGALEQDTGTYMAEIAGEKCPCLADYLDLVSDLFRFPIKAKGLDGYNDWLRDLTWIPQEKIVIIFHNFEQFLKNDISSKETILEDFNEIILPWWKTEVTNYVVGGRRKKMTVYFVQ